MLKEDSAPQPIPSAPLVKKDKKAVLNEVIEEVQLEQFFTLLPPTGVDADYHILERAYRGLQAPDFARFVTLFVSQGKNINAKGPQGTMLQVISTHRKGGDYAAAIMKHMTPSPLRGTPPIT